MFEIEIYLASFSLEESPPTWRVACILHSYTKSILWSLSTDCFLSIRAANWSLNPLNMLLYQ